MDISWVREYCLTLPHTTEQVQWQDDLVFKVGGKMYAVVALEPRGHWMSLKCSDEDFGELVERVGVIPAPYLARAKWIALEKDHALSHAEIKSLLKKAHDLVFAKLPKKTQATLAARKPTKHKSHRKS